MGKHTCKTARDVGATTGARGSGATTWKWLRDINSNVQAWTRIRHTLSEDALD
jgi:hypothetical protein